MAEKNPPIHLVKFVCGCVGVPIEGAAPLILLDCKHGLWPTIGGAGADLHKFTVLGLLNYSEADDLTFMMRERFERAKRFDKIHDALLFDVLDQLEDKR